MGPLSNHIANERQSLDFCTASPNNVASPTHLASPCPTLLSYIHVQPFLARSRGMKGARPSELAVFKRGRLVACTPHNNEFSCSTAACMSLGNNRSEPRYAPAIIRDQGREGLLLLLYIRKNTHCSTPPMNQPSRSSAIPPITKFGSAESPRHDHPLYVSSPDIAQS